MYQQGGRSVFRSLQTYMTELFCENNSQLLVFNYFRKEVSSQLIEAILKQSEKQVQKKLCICVSIERIKEFTNEFTNRSRTSIFGNKYNLPATQNQFPPRGFVNYAIGEYFLQPLPRYLQLRTRKFVLAKKILRKYFTKTGLHKNLIFF